MTTHTFFVFLLDTTGINVSEVLESLRATLGGDWVCDHDDALQEPASR